MTGQNKKAIPVFSSFKPKLPPNPEPKDRPEERRRHRSDREPRHRSSLGHDREHDHKRRHRRHHYRHGSPPEDKPQPPHEDASLRDSSDLYVIDRKGDKYILVYGTVNRYAVPSYHRVGAGRVVGLPLNYHIDRSQDDGKTVALKTREQCEDGPSKVRNAWRQTPKARKVYRVRRDEEANPVLDLDQDFLPLNPNASRKRRRLDDGGASREGSPERVDYRSIEGKAKATRDEWFESDSEMEAEADLVGEQQARMKNAALSKRVADNPYDVDAWLELIGHQESLVGTEDGQGQRRLTASERRSVADVRMSMYEKALRQLPASAPRDRLLLGMLEEGATFWDTKTLASEWRRILVQNPGYISLWMRYLNFEQTNFMTFTYDQCLSIYVECLKMNATSTSSERDAINLYLILRLSLFMRECGFQELSVAIWQAMLEYNLFRPPQFERSSETEAAKDSFCKFWDSEVPRIGEPDAKDWDGPTTNAPSSKRDQPPSEIRPDAVYTSWTRAEWERMRDSLMPARALDEIYADDPWRVTLSSDLRDILVRFPPYMNALLVDAFLLFCRLPPVSVDDARLLSEWRVDPFIRNDFLDHPDASAPAWFSALSSVEEPTTNPPAAFPVANVAISADTLFAGNGWFSTLRLWREQYVVGKGLVDAGWVRTTLRQLVERLPEHGALAELAVAVELAGDDDNAARARKYARRLLKQRPADVRLYNAYAAVEIRCGRPAEAERVLETTLRMAGGGGVGLGERARTECVLLWRTWAWALLECGEPGRAAAVVASIPDREVVRRGETQAQAKTEAESESGTGTTTTTTTATGSTATPTPTPVELLRSQRFLANAQTAALPLRRPDVFCAAAECAALLAYLTPSPSAAASHGDRPPLERALAVLRTAEQQVDGGGGDGTDGVEYAARELLHQARAKLLHHQVCASAERRLSFSVSSASASSSYHRPAVVRDALAESIDLFPANTMFLALFAWNEGRFRVDDRVRTLVRTQQQQQHSGVGSASTSSSSVSSKLITHLFSIYTELHRGTAAGSTLHSVRAAFEKALAPPTTTTTGAGAGIGQQQPLTDPAGVPSAALWKLYVLLEVAVGEPGRAKEVMLRGVWACPWAARELLLVALGCGGAGVVGAIVGGGGDGKGEDGIGWGQMSRVWNVLREKELRVFVDLEEWVEEHGYGSGFGFRFGDGGRDGAAADRGAGVMPLLDDTSSGPEGDQE